MDHTDMQQGFRAIALNMEGKSAPEIAEILKVHRANVSVWISNFEQYGTDALLEGHRPGRPGKSYQKQNLKNYLK